MKKPRSDFQQAVADAGLTRLPGLYVDNEDMPRILGMADKVEERINSIRAKFKVRPQGKDHLAIMILRAKIELLNEINAAFVETTPTHTLEVEAFHDRLLKIRRDLV